MVSILLSISILGQLGDANDDGCVDLLDFALMQREFDGPDCPDPNPRMEMMLVDGGGAGPQYDFLIGKYEVTNEQFAMFLNDAQADAGQTPRGSSLLFRLDGRMDTLGGTFMFRPHYGGYESRIVYNGDATIGARYRVLHGYARHPVTGVSWLGALKFCNWLTIVDGLGDDARAYTEGPHVNNWQAGSIGELIEDVRGYRLPMDNLGSATGFVSNQVNDYNEWYKAASYDPAAPSFARLGIYGETVPADHWFYGFGRDTLQPSDAHYDSGLTPFVGTAPVGYFNGKEWLCANGGSTRDSDNQYGLYDMTGNVAEWLQDQTSSGMRATRGGTTTSNPLALTRDSQLLETTAGTIGFRVVRVPAQ